MSFPKSRDRTDRRNGSFMHNSGSKLVLALTGLALLLGATSWWYRYQAAHRSTQFWGADSSRLIAESEGLEVFTFEPVRNARELTQVGITTNSGPTDLSKARGQAHLRHALMSDRNYVWDQPLDTAETRWRWSLRFYELDRQVQVVLSDDLSLIGKVDVTGDAVTAYSCAPMTASLAEYFRVLGLLKKSTVAAPGISASTHSE